MFGDYVWKVVASGTGVPVTATDETSHTPILFWVLVVFLVADLLVLAGRFVHKRVRRRRGAPADDIRKADFDQASFDRLLLDDREDEFV